jgi:protein-disulfide isomerase
MPRKKTLKAKSEEAVYAPPMQPASPGPSNLLVLLLIVVSFFAGYLFFRLKSVEQSNLANTQNQQQKAPARPTELKIKKPTTSEHWRGSSDVRYVWVEYADMECAFCKQIHPDLVKLLQVYDGKIAWVFRQYPLPFHPKAQKSAEAVECANDEAGNDAFWKMQDAIYEKMPTMELVDLPTIAASIGLDEATFKQCLDSGKFAKKVKDQLNEGSKTGVQATPSNVVYDLKTGHNFLIEGALPYDSLKTSLDGFMAKYK